jgi:hypothetical protein
MVQWPDILIGYSHNGVNDNGQTVNRHADESYFGMPIRYPSAGLSQSLPLLLLMN